MVSDVSRVLVVLLIILLAFSTALACVGTEQVDIPLPSFISLLCKLWDCVEQVQRHCSQHLSLQITGSLNEETPQSGMG
jgi:hypothetical protein